MTSTREFKMLPERTTVKKDGVYTFDTDAYPVQYVPESYVVNLTGVTIDFPDLRKGNAYAWQQWDDGGDPRESAISVITIGPQEWGPDTVLNPPTDSGTVLDDEVIATVPDKCDHILVRVKGSRTTNPSQINGNTIPSFIKASQWMTAYGGSLPLEWLYPIARFAQIFLADTDNGDGTRNVILRRYQSTVNAYQNFYRSDNDYAKEGWNWGGTYGSAYGILVSQRDTKGPSTDVSGVGGRFKRLGAQAASVTDNTNYRSIYTFDIEITAGRSNITPSTGTGAGEAQFGMVDAFGGNNTSNVHTRTVQLGEARADRKVIISVNARENTTGRNLTQVKLGSTVMTQIAYQQHSTGGATALCGIYICDFPTGTSASLELTFSGSMDASDGAVYVGYNMNSSTADATIQTTGNWNTDRALTTVDGGFAVAMSLQVGGMSWANVLFYNLIDQNTITGIENGLASNSGTASNNDVPTYSRGHQLTTGTTLQVKAQAEGVGGDLNPTNRPLVAASFH